MRVYSSSVLKMSAVFALVSCGKAPLSRSLATAPASFNLATFTHDAWCTAWNLSCPAEPTPNGSEPLNKAQIKSLLSIGRSIGNSATALSLSRSDLDAPAIASAVATLGLQAEWTALRNRLNNVKFSNLVLSQGKIVVTSDAAATTTGKSGLSVQTAPEVSIAVTPEFDLAISGLKLSAPGGQSSAISSLTLNGGDTADWRGGDLNVRRTPVSFLTREVLGITDTQVKAKSDLAFKDIVPLIVPLTEWLDAGQQRDIDLGREQVIALRNELPNLIKDPATERKLAKVLDKIQSIQSTSSGRADHTLQLTASQEIRCNVDGKIDFTLETSFGLGHVSRSDGADDTLVSLQVEGFHITLPGPLPLPVSISRIELAPTKIWIRDLPVIGSISLDVGELPKDGDSNDTLTKINCR